MKEADPISLPSSDFSEYLISNIQGGVIICQFDPNIAGSKTIYISEEWTKLTGYTLEELNEKFSGNPQAIIYAQDSPKANDDYMKQTSTGNKYQLEYRIRHKDGRLIWTIDRGVITFTADGYNQNQSILTDITPMKENEEKLRMSEARFRIATNASHAAVFEFDLAANRYLYIENAQVIFHVNAQTVIFALEAAKCRGSSSALEDVLRVWYHTDDIPLLMHAYVEVLERGISECEVRVKQPSGEYIWCKLHQAAVDDENGRPFRIIGHLVDVDEQHKQTQRLLLQSQSDALTGVFNKGAIRERIGNALKNSPNSCHVLFMVDIDNFKGVNDRLGHLFGDAVLMDVSSKLRRLFRWDGVVGRIGGDEFVVLLQRDCSEQEAAERAEKICNVFRQTYAGEKNDYKISCSVGVALSVPSDGYDSLFQKSDLALYRAKALGKDQFVVYTAQLNQSDGLEKAVIHQTDSTDSGKLEIKERIFELLYDSVDFSGSVNMILALLGQLLDASRIYIFENSSDNCFSEKIYEWCAEGVSPATGQNKLLPIKQLDYFTQFDSSGIYQNSHCEECPPSLQTIHGENRIQSTFQVAILEEGVIRGFMGYDSIRNPTADPSELTEIMIFAAKVTGTFIIKKRADESVKLFNQNKMEALDSLPSAIYVIDEQYRLQYINNFVFSVFSDVKLGQKCHEVFMHDPAPCSNCPAKDCRSGPSSTEIYNPFSNMWLLTSAATIRWSGRSNMRLLCCQTIDQYKK